MQTTFKIFIIIASLFVPLFLIFTFIMLEWCVFGEGSGADEAAQKYGKVYIAAYVILGVLHGWLLYRLFRKNTAWVKVAVFVIVGIAYILTLYNLNTFWYQISIHPR